MKKQFAPALRVEWAEDFPKEVRGAVEPHLSASLDLVPRWLRGVFVHYDAEPGENPPPISITVEADYGHAKLRVSPRFVESAEHERLALLEHEMLHISQWPMYDVVEDIVEHLKKDNEALAEWFDKQMNRAIERANCDLCDVLERRRR